MNIFGFEIDIKRAASATDLVAEARGQEARSETSGLGNPSQWLFESLGADGSSSGVTVTEEGSMRLAAVYACVRVLAEGVSSLPLKLYRRSETGDREVAREHPLYEVLHRRSNAMMGAMQLRELMMVHLTLWGNFYAEVQRDGAGRVVGLWPILPWKVRVEKTKDATSPTRVYHVQGVQQPLSQGRIFHVAGLGFDGVKGKSPVRMMRESLGMASAAERYGAKFFANDARPSVVLEHPGQLGDEAFEHLRSSWNAMHQGSGNAYKPAILEEGMKLNTVGLPPDDAQFIETRKYQRSEIASMFRVPPHLIGDLEHATFSNIEHQGLEFVMHTLRPWLVRVEQAILLQLVDEREQDTVYAEHTVDALLRGDIQARYNAYAVGRNWGWLSANDVRALENLNAVDGGDTYLQPLNMVPAGDPPPAGDGMRSGRPMLALPEARAVETRALPERYASSKALEPLYLRAIGRAVRREVRDIRAAVRDHLEGESVDVRAFGDWLVAYTDEHAERMRGDLLPTYREMAEAMADAAAAELDVTVSADDLDTFLRDYVEVYALRHAGSTRGQLLWLVEESEDPAAAATERLDEWEEDRAETETGRELVRSANAFTKAAWALVGVTAISWRAVGKSCPYCDELDGRTVEITRSFLEAGESVADLTVSTRVGHPPVHNGCDCILMPETGSRAALSVAEIRTVLHDIADGAGAGLDDCGAGCAHDHGEPRGRAWRVERDEQIRERDRQIGKAFDSRAAAFAAIAREFSVSPRTVERAVYRR